MTRLHDFGSVLGQPLDTSSGLSQFHGHISWLVCEVAFSIFRDRLVSYIERSNLTSFGVYVFPMGKDIRVVYEMG